MSNYPKFILFAAFSVAIVFQSCKDDSDDVSEPNDQVSDQEIINRYLSIDLSELPNYSNPTLPVYFDARVEANNNTPANNPVTDMGATLGRVLFFDKSLSLNNTVACASCHNQADGFSDLEVLSEGFLGGRTGAHSMRLANTVYYGGASMFWDKRAATLEEQTTMPIQDATEMGFNAENGGLDSLLKKLVGLEYYPILFREAFGDETISEGRIQLAIAQYIRSMVSVDSKFDRGFAQVVNGQMPNGNINTDFPNFTAEENEGKSLFLAPPNQGGVGCAGCHQPPTFSLDPNSRSNGLDAGETTVFKSPSLKNAAIGGPMMHDGRFETLAEVVEHYNSGVVNGPALDNRLRNGNQPIRLNLTANQKAALVAFLETLTDESLRTDSKYTDPFI
jgi:cytochrome c peroxidase